jgi:sporulation protein YlmC with PRC-barrel domain
MAVLVAAMVAARSFADDSKARETKGNDTKTSASKVDATNPMHHFRVSTLESLPIRNAAGENVGKVKDIVVDLKTGSIRYVALDFGGFLGVGDKLFAVPWNAFQYQDKPKDEHLVLNVSKERLKSAPGFDKNHWPDMADPHWNSDVDRYYAPASARR